MFKIIHDNDIVYFCNSCGDVFHWVFPTSNGLIDPTAEKPYEGAVVSDVAVGSDGSIQDTAVPEALRKAYQETWNEDYGWYCYIITVAGEPRLALTAEFGWGPKNEGDKRDQKLKEGVLSLAQKLAENIPAVNGNETDVLFPEDTHTPFCQWEVIVSIHPDATQDDMKKIAVAMNEIFGDFGF